MDIILLLLLAVGFISGLISGAAKQLISLVAFVMGFVIACLYYQRLAEAMGDFLPMPVVCQVFAFLLLWVIVPLMAKMAGNLLTSLLDKLFVAGLLNRLLGGLLGLFTYALILGTLISLFSTTDLITEETMQESKLCRPLKAVPEYVINLLKASPRGDFKEPVK